MEQTGFTRRFSLTHSSMLIDTFLDVNRRRASRAAECQEMSTLESQRGNPSTGSPSSLLTTIIASSRPVAPSTSLPSSSFAVFLDMRFVLVSLVSTLAVASAAVMPVAPDEAGYTKHSRVYNVSTAQPPVAPRPNAETHRVGIAQKVNCKPPVRAGLKCYEQRCILLKSGKDSGKELCVPLPHRP